jgi:serine/threonine-protein phosphatase 2A regulatory subunit A
VLKRLPEKGTIIDLEKSGSSTEGTEKGRSLIQDRILPHLEKLQQDDDVDVRYFAMTAAQNWTDTMRMSP